ncbi:general substrate transporter [Cylindrobasidium torrendii FP15055 ss-10]|uniref:General substrate transporter n=1 Tax=Cylindrobasidium torrendii FP15055 ss-10 TaxID=1314674 RepID=A0A0D7BBU6_9AGAR|nr:general substrate transporter [Cylindrobasidium torrendii FP15055 ss-10]
MSGKTFSVYGWTVCLWILLVPFQYGYHISVLNQLHASLTCSPTATALQFKQCIPMTELQFSLLTSIFTVGGLAGSLFANVVSDGYGRRAGSTLSSAILVLGTAIQALAGSVGALCAGRFFVGISAGLGLCVSPVYLAEITPAKLRGKLGVLTQIGIVFGIFGTQVIGLVMGGRDGGWRWVFVGSGALAVAQTAIGAMKLVVDSPEWLAAHGRAVGGPAIHKGTDEEPRGADTEALLSEETDDESPADIRLKTPQSSISLPAVLLKTPSDVRLPLLIVSFAMLSQQVSGINAVLYYSNDILSSTLPDLGPYISLFITIVNVLMTFPPIFLMHRLGPKTLLLISTFGAVTSLILVGVGLNQDWKVLSSVMIVLFVMSFAVGLGPVPFILVPQVSPYYATSALSSIALSLNWIVNFLVGLAFLPLRKLLSGGDPSKQGRVFWVFAAILIVCMLVVARGLKRVGA